MLTELAGLHATLPSIAWHFGVTGFAIAMAFSPGPNNLMVAASGANFGFRRTQAHVAGVTLGCILLLVATAIGLARVFAAIPGFHDGLRWIGAAYLAWLAWRLASAPAPDAADQSARAGTSSARPMTALEAALFQWVNPKAWVITTGLVATYLSEGAEGGQFWVELVLLVIVITICTLGSMTIWCLAGVAIGRWLRRPGARRLFNWTMAGLLLMSLVPIFL
jgi:threonine/homoserine/homoserine lactone efflux protein